MKTARRIALALVAATSVLTPAVLAGSPAALAAASDKPSVIGVDEDGNEIYFTTADTVADPYERLVSGGVPFPDQDEVISEQPDKATGETCHPRTTIKLKNLSNKYKVAYTDSVTNRRSTPLTWEVMTETSKTFTFGLSAGVSGSIKAAIFGQVEVQLNSSVEWSWTTKYGSKVTTTVDPHKHATAQRAVWQEYFSYEYTSYDRTCRMTKGSGTGWAPYKNNWLFTERDA